MPQSPYRLAPESISFLRSIARQIPFESVIKLSQNPEIADSLPLTDIEVTRLRALINSTPISVSILYELKLDRKVRFERGISYTPAELADVAASMTAEHVRGDSLHILDPACGGGILLLALADRLGSRVTRIDGIDLDPNATILTRRALHLTQPRLHLACADAMAHGDGTKYDAIIMNPPYGSTRDRPNLEGLLHLKEMFGNSAGGKLNLYMAFVLHHISQLKDDGVLTAIIPNSWLGIDNGAGFRDLLLRSGYLRKLRINDSQAFPDLGVETVIVTLKKSFSDSFEVVYSNNTSKVLKLSSFAFSTRISLAPSSALQEHLSTCKRLMDLNDKFEPRIAIQAYRTGGGDPPQTKETIKTHPFHHRHPKDSCLKYLEGRDVGRFTLGWSGEYLEYGPWLAECPPLSRFEGPRIIIREVLGAAPRVIQASMIEERAVYNRSVLQIKLAPKGSKIELLALLGYLNSLVASLYLLQNGRKTQRGLFPKIVIADLKELPVPDSLFSCANDIGRLVEDRLTCEEPTKTRRMDLAIDEAIIGAIGLKTGAQEIEEELLATARLLGLPISAAFSQSTLSGAANT